MSLIHLARNNVVLGQFTETEISEGLKNGTYAATDLAWRAGMAQWKPLHEWPAFSEGAIPPSFAPAEISGGTADKNMPAWEHRKDVGFLPALIETTKQVLRQPDATFPRMKRTGGLGAPLAYYLIPQFTMGVVFSVFLGVLFSAGILTGTRGGPPNPAFDKIMQLMAGAGGLAIIGGWLLMFIIMAPIGIFVSAGIYHLMLKLWNACHAPFETTFRVTAYTWGAYSLVSLPLTLLGLIPCVGIIFSLASLALLLWSLIVLVKGLMLTHGSSGGRVIGAVLTPVIFCCCLYGVIIVIALGLAAAGHH